MCRTKVLDSCTPVPNVLINKYGNIEQYNILLPLIFPNKSLATKSMLLEVLGCTFNSRVE